MTTYFSNIHPFETGRFENNYKNVTQTGERASIEAHPANQDCLKIETTFNNGEKHPTTLFHTNYVAINLDKKEVYITEYKRKLTRKIQNEENSTRRRGLCTLCEVIRRNFCPCTTPKISKRQKRKLAKFGEEILNTIDTVLRKYPYDKNFDYWIELEADENIDDIPLLVLYVEQKVELVNIDKYSDRYKLPYEVKRKVFVEVLAMAYKLLHYRLFTEMVMIFNFLLKVNPDGTISCVISPSALFNTILKYVFNIDEEYKNIVLGPRRGLQRLFLHQPFFVVIQNVMLQLFKTESGHHWRDTVEHLPREMYMIYMRLNNDVKIFHGSYLKNLVKELQLPYERTRIECFEKLELLGSGSFGDVHLALHKGSGVKYAIKVIKNYNQSKETNIKLFETLMLATQFDHKNIVKYYDAWTSNDHSNWIAKNTIEDTDCMTSSEINKINLSTYYYTTKTDLESSSQKNEIQEDQWNCEHRYTFIVLQACRSSLHSLMQTADLVEGQCIRYMKEFIKGLEYLNSLGFMHRDVKPQNALISENESLLIADLDTVKRINQTNDGDQIQQTLVRTPAFVSPEMSTKIYNERTDYYSIGITFAKMIGPELCNDMKAFISLIHQDRLPQMIHPQYAFIIRWLTEEDPSDRIGFLSFSTLLSLLEKHKYSRWQPRGFNSYSVMIEHQETEEIMQCIRVVNSKATVREIVKRYSRRSDDKQLRLRIEPAFVFETNCQLLFTGQEQSCVELIDDRLVLVNSSTDYVYICYSVILAQEDEFSPDDFSDYILLLIANSFDMFTKWGSYSFAHFRRCIFYQDCFIIEPCMLDVVSAEYIQTQVAQFWPPEKIFGNAPMSEAGSIFSFGIYMLWNLLLSLEVPEVDRIITIRQLQDGNRPELLSLFQPHISQLIYWLCAHEPEDRPLRKNIPFYFESLNRPPTVDEMFPFRLTHDDIQFTEEIQRPGVMEKVLNRLKICGDFHAIPRRFVVTTYNCHAPELEAACMLDIDEFGQLVSVPRTTDAVDWLISERASKYSDISDTFNLRRLVLSYIHNTFTAVLKSLNEFHKRGLYHGNINITTFLLDENGRFCLANPVLIQKDTEFFSRSAYITEYSSPEQREFLQSSAESDVFSLGVTLYSLICNYHDVVEINVNQFQNDQEQQFPDVVESEYHDVIRQMTKMDPKERIGCAQALAIFDSTCYHLLEKAKDPESKHFVDRTIKTEYQLRQLIST